MVVFRVLLLVLLGFGAGHASAPAQAQQKVVIYSSNDDTLHKLVFAAFTKETGISVEPVSAGSGVVVKRIQTEKDRPGGASAARCSTPTSSSSRPTCRRTATLLRPSFANRPTCGSATTCT